MKSCAPSLPFPHLLLLRASMKKYGIFSAGDNTPGTTVAGDSMLQHGNFVEIFAGKGSKAKVVAAIRLERGQRVQELSSRFRGFGKIIAQLGSLYPLNGSLKD